MGGKFASGFISAAAAKFASTYTRIGDLAGAVAGKGFHKVITRTAVAAVVGGTVAEIGGGKFANGAYTAAFQHLFNAEAKHYAMHMTSTDATHQNAFEKRSHDSAGVNRSLPVSSGKGILSWFKKLLNPISVLDVHAHGSKSGIMGHTSDDSGVYVRGVRSRNPNHITSQQFATALAGSVADGGTVRLFACNSDCLASETAWYLHSLGRSDISVIGSTGKVSPVSGGGASYVFEGGKTFNTYQGRNHVGATANPLNWKP